jgi:spore maturation protein A
MVTFVVMNTASLQLFPATVIALRQAAGAQNPTAILPAVWAASVVTFLVAVTAAAVFRRRPRRHI